jgi:hypothetical protein
LGLAEPRKGTKDTKSFCLSLQLFVAGDCSNGLKPQGGDGGALLGDFDRLSPGSQLWNTRARAFASCCTAVPRDGRSGVAAAAKGVVVVVVVMVAIKKTPGGAGGYRSARIGNRELSD